MEQMRKFQLLFAELDVERGDFLNLAYKLALLYVPGCRSRSTERAQVDPRAAIAR